MTKTVLHIGCGPKDKRSMPRYFHQDDWKEIRLDIDPNAKPDIISSMLDMPLVETASVDAVFSSHNLEHLYPHEVALALKEFRRVLKPNGIAVITLPDLQRVAELIAQDQLEDPAYISPAGPIAPIDILYGYRVAMEKGNLFMAHRTGFTAKTLANHIIKSGFQTATVQRETKYFNLWAIGYVSPIDENQLKLDQNAIFPLPV